MKFKTTLKFLNLKYLQNVEAKTTDEAIKKVLFSLYSDVDGVDFYVKVLNKPNYFLKLDGKTHEFSKVLLKNIPVKKVQWTILAEPMGEK